MGSSPGPPQVAGAQAKLPTPTITLLEDRWTKAQAMAMMDSDTIVRRIFAAYCGAGLVFALIACALTR
jgi:hypothetical protein